MNNKTKEYRKMIADAFIKSLQENPNTWKQMWKSDSCPSNGNTNRKYNGLNRLWLQYNIKKNGFSDPRFYTFKQVQDMGLKVKKDSKAIKVEFWSLYDPEERKTVDFNIAKEYEDKGKKLNLFARYYSVFNGSQIEGLEKYEQPKLSDAAPQEIIDKIAKNMGVDILYDGGDDAFYRPLDDNIHLPLPQVFESQDAYNSTVLHELAHATGAAHRLNRTKGKYFGDEQYAREELVAEIASCFSQNDLGFSIEAEHFTNHKAYVQNWISEISAKEEALMEAIKDAQSAADYILEASEIEKSIAKDEIMIKGDRCNKIDEWQQANSIFIKGRSIEDPDFYFVQIKDNIKNWEFEYDHNPDKKEILKTYLDAMQIEEFDLHEKIFGAVGCKAFRDMEELERLSEEREKIYNNSFNAESKLKEIDTMAADRKTVYIKINEKFVKTDLQSKNDPDKTYNMVKLPRNTVIDGKEAGGYVFFPTYIFNDKLYDSMINIPWQEEKKIRLTKDGETIEVTPVALKKGLEDSYSKWKSNIEQKEMQQEKEQSKSAEKQQKNKQTAKVTTQSKENDFEME